MQYRLRTLLILLGIVPPVLAVAWWARLWAALHTRELRVLAVVFAVPILAIAYGVGRILVLTTLPSRQTELEKRIDWCLSDSPEQEPAHCDEDAAPIPSNPNMD
jgi:hypothetical protein